MTGQSSHSNMNYRLISLMWLILFTLLLLLSGCAQEANNAGSTSEKDTTVASIKITPGGLMFTNTGDTQILSATAYNAAGDELDITDFTWETSKPDSVSVDAGGTATAQTPLGSATITASADGVTSPPLLVTIAQPVPGAVLVNDGQVVGDIRLHDDSEPLSLGSLYDVTLIGLTPPEVGKILISTGEATVGGRVADVREENGQTIVTLEFIGLDELFTAFTVNEKMPLLLSNMVVNEDVAALYDKTTNADGSVTFTPKSSDADAAVTGIVGEPVGTRIILQRGPFECKTSLQAMPVELARLPTITVNPTLSYGVIMENTQLAGVALSGGIAVDANTRWTLARALDGKINCDAEMGRLPIPIGGVASLFFGGWIPFGVGVELAGRIELTGLEFDAKVHADATLMLALDCTAEVSGCDLLHNYSSNSSLETKWTTPSTITDYLSSLRLGPSISGYGFANLDIGVRASRRLKLQVLSTRAGLNMAGTLAVVDGQIEDLNFASNYKLSLDASLGPGDDINNFLRRFGLNFLGEPILFTTSLSESPKAASVTADTDSFIAGDEINFTVKLDPAMIDFLGIYNVFEVRIYQREMDLFRNIVGTLIGTATAASGQTEFSIAWTVDYDGWISNGEFYAFVVTKFLPFPYFESLELGEVMPTADRKIAFVSTRDGNSEVYLMAQDGTNQVNLTNNPAKDISPLWSPDGTRLVFFSNRDDHLNPNMYELYIIDEDGNNLERLSNLPTGLTAYIKYPSWSPDGGKISYFQKTFYPNKTSVNIVNADGSGEIVLEFSCLYLSSQHSAPMWSPDGTILYIKSWALVTDSGGNSYCSGASDQIFAIDTETYEITQVTTFNGDEIFGGMALVSLSPDGTRFAFRGYRRGTAEDFNEIFTFNADGSGLRQVSNIRSPDLKIYYLVWSPDSRNIIFGDSVYGLLSDNIMKIDADGGTPVAIHGMIDGEDVYYSGMSNGSILNGVQFSDDGREIIFSGYASLHPNNQEIFRMNMNNREVTNISQNPSNDMSPSIQY